MLLPDGSDAVYIPRRDTSSRLNALVGGRLFPGIHHRARFECDESEGRCRVVLRKPGGRELLRVSGTNSDVFAATSVFGSLEEASGFFERGALGYSPSDTADRLDGLELRTKEWSVSSLAVDDLYSGFFEDEKRFPTGSVEFDCALLMRDIRHEWHARESLRIEAPGCGTCTG